MFVNKNILCVDDNADTCELITFVFQNAGYQIISCAGPEEGIELARTNSFACIITNFHFAEMDGIDFCCAIRTFDTNTPIVFFTGEAREVRKQAALAAGAQAYITKPIDFEFLKQAVLQIISKNEREMPQNH